MTSLRLAFMGTPEFSVPALHALSRAGHDIAAVYCQPPRPAGRGHKIQKSPVQRAAEGLGLPVRVPRSLKQPAEQQDFAALDLDIAVVVAYGLILPSPILQAPRLGCLNIHASLLPRWRGAAPIQRAVLAGDSETGITIMQMDEGLDTGAMLLQEATSIGPTDTSADLHDRLAEIGARMIVAALDAAAKGSLTPEPQDDAAASYAAKLSKQDGAIDWSRPATHLDAAIRALTPWPGAWFMLNGEMIRIRRAAVLGIDDASAPGTLLDDDFSVRCGEGALRLERVQRAGKPEADGDAVLRGLRLSLGTVLA